MTDYSRLFRLDGKHALVVGAGSGIGREAALALAAQGARVTCADRDLAAARETVARGIAGDGGPAGDGSVRGTPVKGTPLHAVPAEGTPVHAVPAQGTEAHGVPAEGTPAHGTPVEGTAVHAAPAEGTAVHAIPDEGTSGAWAAPGAPGGLAAYELDVLDDDAITRAAEELDDVDVLVFTAATNVRKRMLDYTGEEFDRVVSLNLRASFQLIRAFGKQMAERGSGSIIGFSSIRGTTVEPGQSVYAATKAGLVQLLRTAAAELGPNGVRANAIAPGVVETPLTAQIKDNPAWYDAYAQKGALGRWARPEELAGAVVYLASDAASFVTGSVLAVDGGWTAVDGRFDPPN